jgi:hypothetical protein
MLKLFIPEWSTESVKTYLVDGAYVRTNLLPNGIAFTEGGNGYVYDYISMKEIWIDLYEASTEMLFTLIHELHERYLMGHNYMDYEAAHEAANILELEARRNPDKVESIMAQELERNRDESDWMLVGGDDA